MNESGPFLDARITCTDCPSLCCRANTAMPLRPREAQTLRNGGTELEEMSKEQCRGYKPPRGRKFFKLLTDCGYLEPDGLCDLYGDKTRPRACSEFQMGGLACEVAREWKLPKVDLGMPGIRLDANNKPDIDAA